MRRALVLFVLFSFFSACSPWGSEATPVCTPTGPEVPGNGVDDDCDGLTDECADDADCKDGSPCTYDTCESGVCINAELPDETPCSDGNPCTAGDRCLAGTCSGAPKDCSAFDTACLEGACNPATGQCQAAPRPDGTACDDGRWCTAADACLDGACGGAPRDCDDTDPCTADGCDEAADACSHELQPKPGEEGPEGDPTCSDGADNDCDGKTDGDDPNCTPCTTDGDCDDQNPCTTDTCQESQCDNQPAGDGTPCDDGLYCTEADSCTGGVCSGTERACTSGGACREGYCDEVQDRCDSRLLPDGADCDDGQWCTVSDSCSNGGCDGVPRDCDDGDFCTDDWCDEYEDRCVNEMMGMGGEEEGPPGDPTCANGIDDDCDGQTDEQDPDCGGCSQDFQCDDGNPCTEDVCVDNACSHEPAAGGTACDDGQWCTVDDTCQDGACTGTPKNCPAGRACDEQYDRCGQAPVTGCCLGQGWFEPGASAQAGDWARDIASADFDGDGILDAALSVSHGAYLGEVALLWGNESDGQADGTFTLQTNVIGGLADAPLLLAEDLDRDGLSDLVLGIPSDNRLVVYTSNGNRSFEARVTIELAAAPAGLAAGDFDADGVSDLAAAVPGGLRVCLAGADDGRWDGTFGTPSGPLPLGATPADVVAADFDEDGILDLAVGHTGEGRVALLAGNGADGRGDGTFDGPVYVSLCGMQDNGPWLAAGDFDADGVLDLAAAGTANASAEVGVCLLRGLGTSGVGNGGFTTGWSSSLAWMGVSDLAARDVNRDGILDLLLGAGEGGGLGVLLGGGADGKGDGTFVTSDVFWHPELYMGGGRLAAGDFDADGILDVALAASCQGDMESKGCAAVLLGTGSGGRGDGSLAAYAPIDLGDAPGAVAACDLDGDAILDLVVANWGVTAGSVEIRLGAGSDGRGDGTFTERPGLDMAGAVSAAVPVELDRDGVPDLAVVVYGEHGSSSPEIRLYLGQGDGDFGAPVIIGKDHLTDPVHLVAADFDADAILDLAVSDHDGQVVIFTGDGENGAWNRAGFTHASTVDLTGHFPAGPGQLTELVTGDFDGDAIGDLAVTSKGDDGSGKVLVMLGNGTNGRGDGTFSLHPAVGSYDLSGAGRGLVAADFDRDGVLDLAATDGGDGVRVLLGQTTGEGVPDGTFAWNGESYAAGVGADPHGLVAVDLNRDGALDLVVSASASYEVDILLGDLTDGAPDGTFTPLAGSVTVGPNPLGLAAGDFDADGRTDVVVVCRDENSMYLLGGGGVCL